MFAVFEDLLVAEEKLTVLVPSETRRKVLTLASDFLLVLCNSVVSGIHEGLQVDRVVCDMEV